MEWLSYTFPVSGVNTWLWLPPLVAFILSFFTSMVGVSGAFLLLPFQMSFLGFVSPAVSATNLVYNLVATPGGIWRYIHEGRMLWPLTWVIVTGTLPGVVVGYQIRIHWLPDPHHFKLFVGTVLLFIAGRLILDLGQRSPLPPTPPGVQSTVVSPVVREREETTIQSCTLWRLHFTFRGEEHVNHNGVLFLISLVVGVIGGIYGIGGGAFIAPICVAFLNLPVYAVAGAALAGTFFTSVVGVLFYSLLPAPAHLSTHPDWLLGALFGLGGVAGMALGAQYQTLFSARTLKFFLSALMLFPAIRYFIQFFQ